MFFLYLRKVFSTASLSQPSWFLHLWPLRGCTASAFVCTFLSDDSQLQHMLRSLISNIAKTTSHTCMAFIHPLSPSSLFSLFEHTLCTLCSKSEPALFYESQSPCGFVTADTLLLKMCSSHRFVKGEDLCRQQLTEFPHSCLVPCNTAKLHHFKAWCLIWNIQQLYHIYYTWKKKPVHAVPALLILQNLMIIGWNRTREWLPLEPRLYI